MIQVEGIDVSFRKENQKKIFGVERQKVLHNVSFQVKQGECMGILGESGSGKSTLGRVLCGLLRPDKGNVYLAGQKQYDRKTKRSKDKTIISVVFQDYTTSANPRFLVKDIIAESLKVREKREQISLDYKKEISNLLELVGLNHEYAKRYPHELSGGQLQRVCIARAIAVNPQIILFDEAISSLDAHTQVQIMDLLLEVRKKYHLTYVFITHDLTSITYCCDKVLFLYQGKVVETRAVQEIGRVEHEYAKKLLNSILEIEVKEHVSA